MSLPFLFVWKDREPEADEALWPWSLCYSWVQETGGEKKRHAAKVPSWRRMGNLGSINWGCSLALGGWLAILSLHPRVSLTSLIWGWAVVLGPERSESNHMCFHSAQRWNWLHVTIDPAAPAHAVKQAFSRGLGSSRIQSCGLGPNAGGVRVGWGGGCSPEITHCCLSSEQAPKSASGKSSPHLWDTEFLFHNA